MIVMGLSLIAGCKDKDKAYPSECLHGDRDDQMLRCCMNQIHKDTIMVWLFFIKLDIQYNFLMLFSSWHLHICFYKKYKLLCIVS